MKYGKIQSDWYPGTRKHASVQRRIASSNQLCAINTKALWKKSSIFGHIHQKIEVHIKVKHKKSRTVISCFHNDDDVIKRKHFPRYWTFMRGIHRSPVNSPHKGQWRRALMFSLIFAWTNSWVITLDAGDLRCRSAHYDAIVMDIAALFRD